jgi:hypothetical protein
MSPIALPPELVRHCRSAAWKGRAAIRFFAFFGRKPLIRLETEKLEFVIIWQTRRRLRPAMAGAFPPRSLDCERPRCQEQRSSACCSASFYCELLI